jgi:hypothetical protein
VKPSPWLSQHRSVITSKLKTLRSQHQGSSTRITGGEDSDIKLRTDKRPSLHSIDPSRAFINPIAAKLGLTPSLSTSLLTSASPLLTFSTISPRLTTNGSNFSRTDSHASGPEIRESSISIPISTNLSISSFTPRNCGLHGSGTKSTRLKRRLLYSGHRGLMAVQCCTHLLSDDVTAAQCALASEDAGDAGVRIEFWVFGYDGLEPDVTHGSPSL